MRIAAENGAGHAARILSTRAELSRASVGNSRADAADWNSVSQTGQTEEQSRPDFQVMAEADDI